jgi:hypothetical protein
MIGATMTVAATDDQLATALRLLEAGIPMSLLLDLASGPNSRDLYLSEAPGTDWLSGLHASRLAG